VSEGVERMGRSSASALEEPGALGRVEGTRHEGGRVTAALGKGGGALVHGCHALPSGDNCRTGGGHSSGRFGGHFWARSGPNLDIGPIQCLLC
jgi:hypothetical protein